MAIATDNDFLVGAQARSGPFAREALGASISGLIALLGFWRISGVSWSDISGLWGSSDAIVEYSMSKTQSGSILRLFDPNLGHPHGQDWTHFPVLDPANRIELSVLNLFLGPVTAVNVLFVASFPIIAMLMYAVLRNVGVMRSLAVVGGVSLALVGYHFDYEHPYLGNYWAVPLGILWLSVLANCDTVLARRYRQRTVFVVGVAAGLAVGLHNPQYTVFFSLIGVVAVLVAQGDTQSSLNLLRRVVVLAVPAATLVTWLAFGRLFRTVPSVTPSADRPLIDSYVWAGRFISLLTTPGDSVLSGLPFNHELLAAQEIPDVTGVSAVQSAPVVAATFLVAVLILALIAASSRASGLRSVLVDSVRPWAAMWAVAAGFFVTGGMGVVFAAVVYPQVRGWARIAVIMAALALTTSLIIATGLLRRWNSGPSRRHRVYFLALAGFISIVFLDQFSARYPISQDSTTLPALRDLVSGKESNLEAGCPILNVPIISFPEALPPGRTLAYDQLLPYLAGVPGSFSYGAIRGQLGSRWTDHLAVQPGALAEQAAAEGFCAILVDSSGLDSDSPSIEQFEQALGAPTSTAMDRWFLFALPSVARVDPRSSLFSKPEVNYGSDFTPEWIADSGEMVRWTRGTDASLKVWNPGVQEMEWIAQATVLAADCPNEQSVEVSTVSGYRNTFRLAPGEVREVLIPLRVPSRSNAVVSIATPSPGCMQDGEAVPVGVRISDLRFTTNRQPGADITEFNGFHPVEFGESGDVWRWMNGNSGVIEILSTSDEPTTVTVTGQLQGPLCSPSDVVSVSADGNADQSFTVTPETAVSFVVPLSLQPFASATVGFSSASAGCFVDGDDRLLGPKVQNLRISSSVSNQ